MQNPNNQLQHIIWACMDILRKKVSQEELSIHLIGLLFIKLVHDDTKRWAAQEKVSWHQVYNPTSFDGYYRLLHSIMRLNSDFDEIISATRLETLPEILGKDLLGIFDLLGNIDLSSLPYTDIHDVIASLYERSSSRSLLEHYTPDSVSQLLAKLTNSKTAQTIYDPACGTGSLLLNTYNILKNSNSRLEIYGQEINKTTSQVARILFSVPCVPK